MKNKLRLFLWLWKNIHTGFYIRDRFIRTGYLVIQRKSDETYEIVEYANGTFDRKITP